MELRHEVKGDEMRIAGKEEELKTEEAQQAKLQADIKTLQQDLSARQMTADDLQSRLVELRRANASTSAKTQEEQARKRQRDATFKKHEREVADVQQSGASIEDKRKRLQYLKGEIRKSLILLEHS
jgi:chromosome segregation ATPase